MQDIFRFERRGLDSKGKVIGQHVPTGVQPRFLERFREAGLKISPEIFMR